MKENVTFVDGWDDPIITPNVQRMYAKKVPANEASEEYIDSCLVSF